jgi:hypothetical protein
MYDCAGRSFIMPLNTQTFSNYANGLSPADMVRQPIAKDPDQSSAPLPYGGNPSTDARIQTHQNLFTLTKNNSAPQH